MNYNNYSDDYLDSLGESNLLNKRLTWHQISKNDFEHVKKCIDHVDSQYSCYGDKRNRERIEMNYQLANGQGETAMNKYGNEIRYELLSEGFSEQDMYGHIQHHPVIQVVYNAMVGEQQLRPLTPMAMDLSGAALNQRKRDRLKITQEYLRGKIIDPMLKQIEAKVTQEYSQQYQVKDPFQLGPQEQAQMQSDIQNRLLQMTPKEVQEYMRKDYKSPGAIEAQKILDFAMSDLDIKYHTDENFKNLLISGMEIYKVGIRHGKAYFENVNPMGFYYIARPNSNFIEDGIAWKYEQYVMDSDINSWHGEEIGNSRLIKDQLELLTHGGRERKPGDPHPQMVAEVARGNVGFVHNAPNLNTNEGQEYLKDVLTGLGSRSQRNPGDIRYVHCAYKGLRKIKQLKRYNSEKNICKSIWIDESYTFNPIKDRDGFRDVEEYICWAPQIFEGVRVDNNIYLGVGPTEYQYKNPNNPWEIKGPYVGAQYSKLMGNTTSIAPIDPAKPWQYKFNLQMKHIHELEATDLGKVLHMPVGMQPKDWNYKKQFLMMKYGKQLITDHTQEGGDPNMYNAVKHIDLSTDDKILTKLQYLDFLKAQIILSMSYNPSRLGMQGPTTAVTNNQQNIVQSSYQTNDIFNLHNKIVENLLNVVVDAEKCALKDNQALRGYIMDDLSIADLELNWELLDEAEIQIKIKNSSQEFQNVQEIKMQIQPMVQNGLMTFPDAIRAQFAKSQYELMNIAENAQENSEKRAQQAQQAQEEMMKRQEQLALQVEQMKQQFELELQKRDHAMELQQALIQSTERAQAADIDQNKIADTISLEILKQEFELIKLDKEIQLKKDEQVFTEDLELKRFELEKELANKKIEIEKIKASRPKSTSSK
jgi:hypothetical protein